MEGPVNIGLCPEHGLHGERTECFVCGGNVEQVPMVTLKEHDRIIAALSDAIGLAEHLRVFTSGRERARIERSIAELRAIRNGRPLPDLNGTHRVETYKPRPRPDGETNARIRAAIQPR